MTRQQTLRIKSSCQVSLCLLLLSLSQFVMPFGSAAKTTLAPAPPDNNCITQAVVQINKLRYLGKNSNGQDEVEVDWLVQSVSDCVVFGSGQDVVGKTSIPPYGYEITVKIKRRLGHEDSATVRKGEIVKGNVKTIVRIPRANLETDPVSYEAKIETTAGAVLRKILHVSGNGAPSLTGATQTFSKHSTVANTPDGCYPTLQVSAISFIPGSGATPDNVTINWGAGSPPLACFDPPKFSIAVRITRPGGHVDTVQADFNPRTSTATLQLSGVPGAVVSFDVIVTATSGAVVGKTGTQSGNF